MAAFKHNNPECTTCTCSSGTPNLYCEPCDIPLSNLTLSWYYWKPTTGTSTGTTYAPAGPVATSLVFQGGGGPNYRWTSGWFAGPRDSVACNNPTVKINPVTGQSYVDGSACCYLRFTLSCNQAQGTNMSIELSSDPTAPLGSVNNTTGYHQGYGAAYCYDGTVVARVGPATFQCSPFMATYGNTGYVGNLFYSGIATL